MAVVKMNDFYHTWEKMNLRITNIVINGKKFVTEGEDLRHWDIVKANLAWSDTHRDFIIDETRTLYDIHFKDSRGRWQLLENDTSSVKVEEGLEFTMSQIGGEN